MIEKLESLFLDLLFILATYFHRFTAINSIQFVF